MRKLISALPIITILWLLAGPFALAQDTEPTNHEDLVSGGAVEPDMENESPGPSSSEQQGQPQVGPNVRVNNPQQPFPNGLLGRSETTVAASEDGKQVLAGFNNAQGFCGPPFGVACTPPATPGLSGFGFSTDGGLTFTDAGAPPVINNAFTRGDPWMDRGGLDEETFFYANLAVDATTGASLGVSVHRGHFTNGGFSFADVRLLQPSNPNDFFDKEAIATDKHGSGAAYVSLTNFIALPCPAFPNVAGAFGQIEVFRTQDGGDTWQGPVIVSPDQTSANPADPNCGNTGVLQQSSVPAIGPEGEVYVAWQFGPTFSGTGGSVLSTDAAITVARSLDGGVTFGAPVTVASINSMRRNPPVGYNRSRINDHPRIAVATEGAHEGRVFVAFYSAVSPVSAGSTVQSLVSSQVFVSFSDDQGQTWTTPTPVAPAPPATGVKRWWPVVTVEENGTVDVIYYESQEASIGTTCSVGIGGGRRRTGSAVSLVDTFLAQSLDGGVTFGAPIKVTSATSNWCTTVSNIRPNFGDYIGSAIGNELLFPVWADGRNGVPDTFAAQVLVGSQ